MSKVDALIMAAGRGERFGTDAKQFMPLNGRPVLAWSMTLFDQDPGVQRITVVAAPGDEETVHRIVEEHRLGKVDAVVAGGPTRQQSVWLGLQTLDGSSDKILVHDAVRPCVSGALVRGIMNALDTCGAVVPTLPAVETLVLEKHGVLDGVLDRIAVSGVQTPQGFSTDLLIRAHRRAMSRGLLCSDDGSLVFATGETVRAIAGERTNIKITYAADIAIAEAILTGMEKARGHRATGGDIGA
jgi:2-C-methyl-D-erythritol 4-phosphate cytidylyltransferase